MARTYPVWGNGKPFFSFSGEMIDALRTRNSGGAQAFRLRFPVRLTACAPAAGAVRGVCERRESPKKQCISLAGAAFQVALSLLRGV